MPSYHRLGQIPPKRHTQFRRPDGGLYAEEVFGTEGFSGNYSILYYHYPPTAVKKVEKYTPPTRHELWDEGYQRHHHFKTAQLPRGGDPVFGRQALMYNDDVVIGVAKPTEPMNYYFRDAENDLMYFVHEGHGTLETNFGLLPYHQGDYIIIPRGTTFRFLIEADSPETVFLAVEARGSLVPPKRYLNQYGQMLEHAPYCERDIRRPEELITHLEAGDFEVRLKVGNTFTSYWFDHHPLNVVGWDGYEYPWIFNIHDFEPITGRVHQPPPVHQTFEGPNFVVCSFVPRKLDYHPLSIPVPYNHSNIDSDEMIYYVNGNFGSRRGVEVASITLHPRGIPHGPQPGAVEKSLGAERTEEMAVMIDTFHPLKLTTTAQSVDDPNYPYSWIS
ncbi:homogentisate 1,2-dioxygenase [Thermosporothrix hazakensis]|jgi:homogentisate 1,2-dioxygenase|uniref:Homogentisate 1,2-dioxygenase n=2 Tax=Thermosporothrix TaxID=768650 RepID=A0A326U4X0_THEHA|nr:homogentisate 1,2-dioxygenase [Thermosporothrix hazakensis]PZW26402.1 homogentisate 1,2-dioxygenase [Thermosporothrix hazakensis]BBH90596.1 homogentisate 1,2-dioxygenase [Thermosporothrix sp. COM3]GCE48647.1 homogentisate 1,2-dioxygenase [Thermosporothrix hazakensis]